MLKCDMVTLFLHDNDGVTDQHAVSMQLTWPVGLLTFLWAGSAVRNRLIPDGLTQWKSRSSG